MKGALKVHGHVEEPETFIFTKEQYDKAYGEKDRMDGPLAKTLRQIYISHSLLFLGCRLEADRTLQLFKQVKESGGFEIPEHFAFLPLPKDDEAKKQKESKLLEIEIQPIWYSPKNEHEMLAKLIKLGCDVARGLVKLQFPKQYPRGSSV